METKEKKIDDYIASKLQEKKIDFLRIKNSNFRGYNNYNTTAFGKDKDGKYRQCDKYWPDFVFVFNKKVYMIENGLKEGNKIKNQDRKDMQLERMKHWVTNGGCKGVIILSVKEAEKFFKKIKLLES